MSSAMSTGPGFNPMLQAMGGGPNGGPSKEFEEYFYKMTDPKAHKKKYSKKLKQDLMPPSYLCKQPKGKKSSVHQAACAVRDSSDEREFQAKGS